MDLEKELKKAIKHPHQEITLDLTNAHWQIQNELKEEIFYLTLQKHKIEKNLNILIRKYEKCDDVKYLKNKKGDKFKCFKRSKN